jgi:DNA (cytosine-5)-methyltransferase 1
LRYLSVCSGIEAASVAWHPMGWQPVGFSEIERFPSAVLAHHWPDVPNLGDLTQHHGWPNTLRPDLIVGGTPCQAFSVAGLRRGLEDPRGNLTLVFLGLLEQFRPRWVVWENVPGVLSDSTGAFGAFLGGLAKLGYGFAYRVLDAQHFGVPQRRRRVFVVGYLGDWRRAAAVLFEPESLRGDSPPRREAGQGVAPTLSARTKGGGGLGTDFDPDGGLISPAVTSKWAKGSGGPSGDECQNLVCQAYRTSGNCGAWETGDKVDAITTGTDRTSHVLAFDTTQITSAENRSNPQPGDPCHPLAAGAHAPALAFMIHGTDKTDRVASETDLAGCLRTKPPGSIENSSTTVAVSPTAFNLRGREGGAMPEVDPDGLACQRAASGGSSRSYVATTAVRRLTPRECERLQGFPDDYTLIPWRGLIDDRCPDGPRYKALGNSMAVPVMRWIGERINQLNDQGLATQPAPQMPEKHK